MRFIIRSEATAGYCQLYHTIKGFKQIYWQYFNGSEQLLAD